MEARVNPRKTDFHLFIEPLLFFLAPVAVLVRRALSHQVCIWTSKDEPNANVTS